MQVKRAMDVAQLAERKLPTTEVHNLNPVIGKIMLYPWFLLTVEKTKIKVKNSCEWSI